ncbi:MAG: DUF4080 domain-containing protein [Dysgonomonas sp.]
MKVILTTLNAKYIHTSLALRWLYVANKDQFDISFKEYVIKEDLLTITDELLQLKPDVIGISVYIWNVEKSKCLVDLLREKSPQTTIILGGPEVTYEPDFFLTNWNVDYVISGEGEFVLGELLSALEDNNRLDIDGVSTKDHISRVVVKADLERLTTLSSPYQLDEDREHMKNRLIYFETSRGCPYQCQYCLSSLEKGVRYFPQQYIFDNLLYFTQSNAKQIKFLDRTFNLNRAHTKSVFDFLIDNYRPGLSCQFEIYADLLTDDSINYLNERLPKNYFRFEIGIQSTYEPTNIAVNRKQDFELLSGNIQKLMDGGKIDLHLDLIAGLPYETLDRFRKSFNDVFKLKAKELQLGFLKMLRGTALRRNAGKFGYRYNQQAPYEIESNNDISSGELEQIHDAEHALEKYWNSGKFKRTMNILVETYYKDKYFELFDEIWQYYNQQNYPHHGYRLEDIFMYLNNFLVSKDIDLFDELRTDYYLNFKIRPHGFWDNKIEKRERKQLLYQIGNDKPFLKKYGLNRKIIEKQAAIDPVSDNEYLLTIFLQDDNTVDHLFIPYIFTEE